ncbi:hypothetical protein PMIN06_010322 [Paraphaeosphaeria minitans]
MLVGRVMEYVPAFSTVSTPAMQAQMLQRPEDPTRGLLMILVAEMLPKKFQSCFAVNHMRASPHLRRACLLHSPRASSGVAAQKLDPHPPRYGQFSLCGIYLC